MTEIAKAAGVHQTTVSLAFRHHPSIPASTRERLLALAEKMGYRPNPLVSALMSQLRGQRAGKDREVIAYLTSHPKTNPWRRHAAFNEMFAGATSRAAQLGFVLQEFDLESDGMTSERMRGILLARGIRGLLVAPLPDERASIDMDISSFAAATLGLSLQSPPLERVSNDHHQSMQLAFQKCVQLGYRRIGFFIGKVFSEHLENRWLAAYMGEQALLPTRHRLRPLLLESVRREDRQPVLESWNLRERPSVVLAALGAAQEEYRAHWATLPGNVKVVNLTRPVGLTGCAGIMQDTARMGAIGIERVVSRLHNNDFGPLPRIQNTLLHGVWADDPSLPAANI